MKARFLLLSMFITMLAFAIVGCTDNDEPSPSTPSTPSTPETPTEPTVPKFSYKLADNVAIMSDEVAKKIVAGSYEKNEFTISSSVSEDKLPKVGSLIIIDTPTEALPSGLLAKVEGVKSDASGHKISYSYAELTDAFINLDIPEQALEFEVAKVLSPDGTEMKFSQTRASGKTTLHVGIPEVGWEFDKGLSVTPKMSMDLTMLFQLTIAEASIQSLLLKVKNNMVFGADIAISASKDLINKHHPLFSIACTPIVYPPIVIVPFIDVYAVFKATGKISFETSITFKPQFSAMLTYSDAYGVGGKVDMDFLGDDALELSIGPKLEGSINWGLGVGPSFSIYHKNVLTLGMSLDATQKETISAKFDLAAISEGKLNFFEMENPEYNIAFSLMLHTFASLLTKEVSYDVPEAIWPLEKKPVVPQMVDEYTLEVDGGKAVLNMKVEEGALLYGDLKVKFSDASLPEDPNPIVADFDFTQEKRDMLDNGEVSVPVTASATLKDGVSYSFDVVMNLLGFEIVLYHVDAEAAKDDVYEANIRHILKSIYNTARKGEWKDCNWMSDVVPVSKMTNVKVEKKQVAYGYRTPEVMVYTITIPQSWAMNKKLNVEYEWFDWDFQEESGYKYPRNYWDLIIEGKRQMDEIIIEDRGIHQVIMEDSGSEIGTLAIRNSLLAYDMLNSNSFKPSLKTLDFTGSVLDDSKYASPSLYVANILPSERLILDDTYEKECKITIDGRGRTLPAISTKGMENLTSINITNAKIPKAAFVDVESNNTDNLVEIIGGLGNMRIRENSYYDNHKDKHAVGLGLKDCSAAEATVSFAGGFKYIHITSSQFKKIVLDSGAYNLMKFKMYDSTMDAVDVSGCPELVVFDVSKNKIKQLSVLSCLELDELRANSCDGLSSFNASNLPNCYAGIFIQDNTSLTGKMLPIFDEQWTEYDKRYYYYTEDGGKTIKHKDRGYGWYYDGEPSRGYHRSKDWWTWGKGSE